MDFYVTAEFGTYFFHDVSQETDHQKKDLKFLKEFFGKSHRVELKKILF